MVVQHNLTAMNANRMLGITQGTLSKTTEKLSSGYKINRAADDAAGLSISEKMRKQIRGLTQASLNAEDGISAVQTAEGALNEVQDMLQRMNELAVKAANSTNSADDRGYIQDEIDQLVTEIDRVSETTKFNETYLLKGDENAVKDKDFAYNKVYTISQDLYYLDGTEVKTLKKGTFFDEVDSDIKYYSDSSAAKAGEKFDSTASNTHVSSKAVYDGNTALYSKGNDGKFYALQKGDEIDVTNAGSSKYYTAANAASGAPVESDMTLVTDANTNNSEEVYVVSSGKTVYDSDTGKVMSAGEVIGSNASDIEDYYSTITSTLMSGSAVDITKYKSNDVVQFVDKDGNEIAANGLDKYIDNNGKLKKDGLFIKTGEGVTDRVEATQENVDKMVDASKEFKVGALTLKLHVGADATTNNQISVDIESMSAKVLGVDGIKVDGLDDSNALNAIETIKEALNKVSDQRSALGAVQNRLEHTIKNLDNVVENTTAAESQIRDTDMATEMVKYSNNNILAQAGQSMLAQANQSNQGVLSILG